MVLPNTMTVMEISQPGGPEVLRSAQRAIPKVGAAEVLIRVHWAGVNRPDALPTRWCLQGTAGGIGFAGIGVFG